LHYCWTQEQVYDGAIDMVKKGLRVEAIYLLEMHVNRDEQNIVKRKMEDRGNVTQMSYLELTYDNDISMALPQ